MNWFPREPSMVCPSALSPHISQVPINRNTLFKTFARSNDANIQRIGSTPKKMYGGTDKSESSQSKAPGYKHHSTVPNTSQFADKVNLPSIQTIIDEPMGLAAYYLTPPSSTYTPQTMKSNHHLPIYDTSRSHQGSASMPHGLSLLAEAINYCSSSVKRKRSTTQQLASYHDTVHVDSNKITDRKKHRQCTKPFELMCETVFPNDSQALCLMTTLEVKEMNRAVNMNRMWVWFDSPVNVEIRGEEIINHFVLGHAYTPKMMAAIIALFKELDDELYRHDPGPRWRFLLVMYPTVCLPLRQVLLSVYFDIAQGSHVLYIGSNSYL